jgi:hypothetical protein
MQPLADQMNQQRKFTELINIQEIITMKTFVIFPTFLILLLALTSCKKEFPDDPLALSSLTVSSCKTKGGDAKGIVTEYIVIKTVDNYYLKFSHFNSVFNCEPGEINISAEISTDTIIIKEDETTGLANCTCPYDLEFSLGPMKYGTYTIIFQKGGLTYKQYTLIYKKSTNIRIDI